MSAYPRVNANLLYLERKPFFGFVQRESGMENPIATIFQIITNWEHIYTQFRSNNRKLEINTIVNASFLFLSQMLRRRRVERSESGGVLVISIRNVGKDNGVASILYSFSLLEENMDSLYSCIAVQGSSAMYEESKIL